MTLALSGCTRKQSENNQNTQQSSVTVGAFTPEKNISSTIKPGLSVTYYLNFYKRNLEYLNKTDENEYETFQGEPIMEINHQFGNGEVFSSGTSRGVALRMNGYMFFPQPGWYDMQALSNDGVIVYLDNRRVLSDPKQHSDRLSDIGHFKLNTEGWLPVTVEYFQRKGTAALKLFWKTPGSEELVPVPKANLGYSSQ